jgi:AbrB family looped-hinge helix DNA binding protein
MDQAGRLVIPSEIRREAALEPGTPLEVRWHDGRIEIEPQWLPVKLERKGHLLVAQAAVKVPPLRTETVERVRRQLRARNRPRKRTSSLSTRAA